MIAEHLCNGEVPGAADKAYLMSLAHPVYVIVHEAPSAAKSFDPVFYELVYHEADLRLYRVRASF